MKKIALVSTFCDTSEKIEILKTTLLNLSNLGVDSFVITPIELPSEVRELATYTLIDRANPIIRWPEFCSIKYETRNENGVGFKISAGVDEYGFAGLQQVKKLSQVALTYDYDIFYHIIYDLVFGEAVIKAFASDSLTCNFWPFFRGEYSTIASLHLMAFNRENLISFEKLITRENYVSYLVNNPHNAGVERWLINTVATHLSPRFESEYVTDLIYYYKDTDHYDLSKSPSCKMFIQKCNENGFDVRLLVYGFEDKRDIIVRTNLGEQSYSGISPCHFTIANGSDRDLTTCVVQIGDHSQELIEDIRDIGISYFEI